MGVFFPVIENWTEQPQSRHTQAMSDQMPVNPSSTLTEDWPPRLVLDVALRLESDDEIMRRHELDLDTYNRILSTPAFAVQVANMARDLHENGDLFRAKARMQAESLLTTSWVLIHNPSTPANVKADLIKSTVQWADLLPKNRAQEAQGPGLSITFNFPLPSGQPAPALPKAPRPTITVDNA